MVSSEIAKIGVSSWLTSLFHSHKASRREEGGFLITHLPKDGEQPQAIRELAVPKKLGGVIEK